MEKRAAGCRVILLTRMNLYDTGVLA